MATNGIRATLFYKDDAKYSVGSVNMHIILEEQHAVDVVVTEHPVQDGSVISDHVSVKLREGSLKALVSNHSLSEAKTFNPSATPGDELKNVALDAWDRLKQVAEAMQPVTIVTVMETYKNVIVTHVGAVRNGESGDAQEFDVKFKQIKRVQLKEDRITAVVAPSDMDSDLNRDISAHTDSGQRTATAASNGDTALVLGDVDTGSVEE